MKAYDTARAGASLCARQLRRDSTDGVLEKIAAALSSSPSQAVGLGPSLSHGRGRESSE